jgi:orotate phosphoribosyltransferase
MDSGEQELFKIIKERSFRYGEFTLSSGAKSNLYFNLKTTMMSPRGAYLSARAFLRRIAAEKANYVGGLEMGAVPLIGALAALSESEGHPVKTFFVRKSAKVHGTRDVIEGLAPHESLAGAHVLALDDVATSGGSIWRAAETARGAGASVDAALVLIDREEGAAQFLAERGLRLLSVFRGAQFL